MKKRSWTRISVQARTASVVRLACALAALASLAACGGPNKSDADSIIGGGGDPTRGSSTSTPTLVPVLTPTPIEEFPRSGASRISYNAGTEDLFLEMFTEGGLCIVNATTEIAVLVGDFQGRPLANVRVSFFVERGRGLLDASANSDEEGEAQATFRSLCPANAAEEITMAAVLRGSEPFTDLNSNGRHDQEAFTDSNGNGRFDDGEAFVDANSNDEYDIEPFTDLPVEVFLDGNRNGIFEAALDEYMIWDPNNNADYDCGPGGPENNCGDLRYNDDAIISDTAVIVPSFEDDGGPVLNPFTPTATATLEPSPTSPPSQTPVPSVTPIPPTPTLPPVLSQPSNASRLSYQSGTNDITIEMFDEAGRCMVNVTRDIVALVGDFRGRPVTGTEIAFFVESGRGILPERIVTDANGIATAVFRSLCPASSLEEITVVAAVRGSEPFVDLSSNGIWDEGEPFTDLPRDAFLDANRNGVYEPELNEYLIWDADGDGQYDAEGNGEYDSDNIIVAETVLKPVRLGQVDPFPLTRVSALSFGAGTDLRFEMFDTGNMCIVNAVGDIEVVAGDFAGRPVDPQTPIAFFAPRSRGTLPAQALTDEGGVAETQFRSLCPANAAEKIKIVVAARGSEPFVDLNSNGQRDNNEPFEDLPREVFLDADFDGVYEPDRNEYLIWDPNNNGQFDPGGNGIYDTDTIITAEAVMVPHRVGGGPAVDPLALGSTGAVQMAVAVRPNPLPVVDEGGVCFSNTADIV
ncbi:MAG TPA: hypothetical protein VEB21_07795, partial [Terriglobales bacterium]|nr:hypothetical protein [Terriglobales bacterium]